MEILTLVKATQSQGVSARRFCLIMRIEHRRVVRWLQRMDAELTLENQKPGPKDPCHRLLPEEIDQIVTMAISDEHCDLSHRILAVTAWEKDMFHVSFSTVYHVLKDHNLMSGRSPGGFHNGNSKAPVRKVLTGSNQRWCWDISYLMTQQKGQYLYLYLLLDEYSRKVIQWRISWSQTADESLRLLDGGFIEENILDLPEDQRPEIISDRGRQMKAKNTKSKEQPPFL
jgi:putative transposase